MKAITVTVETDDSEMTLEFNTYSELGIWFLTNKELVSDDEFKVSLKKLNDIDIK
jgi:hypothetical protein